MGIRKSWVMEKVYEILALSSLAFVFEIFKNVHFVLPSFNTLQRFKKLVYRPLTEIVPERPDVKFGSQQDLALTKLSSVIIHNFHSIFFAIFKKWKNIVLICWRRWWYGNLETESQSHQR